MIHLQKLGLALLATMIGTMLQQKLSAYTCTLQNNTHSTIVVEFGRYTRSSSGAITIGPMSSGEWDAGKCALVFPCSISGIKIISMTFNGKPVPKAAGFGESWSGVKARAVSVKWTMSEAFPPNADMKSTKVQFTLYREPAGPGGSTYPGGTIWKSDLMDIK